jgi:hypothetical protein
VPLSFDVWIRGDSTEWKIGSGYVRQGGGTVDLGGDPRIPSFTRKGSSRVPGFANERVDVILRPNAREVSRSLDGTELWDEDVVIPEVPVRRTRDPLGRPGR